MIQCTRFGIKVTTRIFFFVQFLLRYDGAACSVHTTSLCHVNGAHSDVFLSRSEHALVFVMITISTICTSLLKVTDYLWLLWQKPSTCLIGARAQVHLTEAVSVWLTAPLQQTGGYLCIQDHRLDSSHSYTHTHTDTGGFTVSLLKMWHVCSLLH